MTSTSRCFAQGNKSEEELVEMEEKAGENLQSSVRKVDRWTTS